jgi:predicted HTH domain antitoxin
MDRTQARNGHQPAATIHPQELTEVLGLVQEGTLGLSAASQRLNLSLEGLAAILAEHGIDPPYSVEDYEQDKRAAGNGS